MLRERETANMSAGMAPLVRRSILGTHLAAALALVLLAFVLLAFAGTAAGSASGTAAGSTAGTPSATLKITINPLPVHPKRRYVVTILGTYRAGGVSGTAYLVDFIQYRRAPCKQTAQAEQSLPANARTFDYAGDEPHSPFKRSQPWIAGNRTGFRHACAYLYSQVVHPNSTARPIARADKRYRDL